MKLTARDRAIIAFALKCVPIAELGDRLNSANDAELAERCRQLARLFTTK